MGACIAMFTLWSCVTSQAGSSGEVNGTSSGVLGCATPGQKCTIGDDCCQECYCNGAANQIDLTSCVEATKTCKTCAVYCGDAGVNYEKGCSRCVRQ